MAKIALLIVDDHIYFRRSLCRICEINGFHIIGEADNEQQALVLAEKLQPDVILLDDDSPTLNSRLVARSIQRTNPQIAIIFLSILYINNKTIQQIPQGDYFFLAKDCEVDVLINAIKKAYWRA